MDCKIQYIFIFKEKKHINNDYILNNHVNCDFIYKKKKFASYITTSILTK